MNLKIKFAKEIRFDMPCRPIIRPWTRMLFGTRLSMRALALAELPKPCKQHFD